MTEEGPPPAKMAKLNREQLQGMSKEELMEKFMEQEAFMETLGGRHDQEGDDVKAKTSESSKRENFLQMQLISKDREMQVYITQVQELKQAQNPSTQQLRSMLLDPAINLMFQRMKKEMDLCREKQEQAQNDLAAWKFTPDSQTGKRLMSRCRMLLQENEELGKVISSGRTAKLESEIALEKTLVQEMKKSQAEMDEFLAELDEDVEGMQSTIYLLQQQLKDVKEQLAQALAENQALRQTVEAKGLSPDTRTEAGVSNHGSPRPTTNGGHTDLGAHRHHSQTNHQHDQGLPQTAHKEPSSKHGWTASRTDGRSDALNPVTDSSAAGDWSPPQDSRPSGGVKVKLEMDSGNAPLGADSERTSSKLSWPSEALPNGLEQSSATDSRLEAGSAGIKMEPMEA